MNENKTTIRKETKQLGNIRAKLQSPLQTENEICAALFAMQDEKLHTELTALLNRFVM